MAMQLDTREFNFPELRDQGISIRRLLDQGTYAKVYEGYDHRRDRKIVVKRQLIQPGQENDHEMEILEELGGKSKFIPELLDVFYDERSRTYSLILPFFDNAPFLTECMSMGLSEFRFYAQNLLMSLWELHEAGFVHRDVKPGNFLYERGNGSRPPRFALLDFGLTQTKEFLMSEHESHERTKNRLYQIAQARNNSAVDDNSMLFKHVRTSPSRPPRREGTRGFRAPEVLMGSYFQDEGLDIWSAGIILASIVTGVYPVFGHMDDDRSALDRLVTVFGKEAIMATAQELDVEVHIHLPVESEPRRKTLRDFLKESCELREDRQEYLQCGDLFEVLEWMLTLSQKERKDADEILGHRFFWPW